MNSLVSPGANPLYLPSPHSTQLGAFPLLFLKASPVGACALGSEACTQVWFTYRTTSLKKTAALPINSFLSAANANRALVSYEISYHPTPISILRFLSGWSLHVWMSSKSLQVDTCIHSTVSRKHYILEVIHHIWLGQSF